MQNCCIFTYHKYKVYPTDIYKACILLNKPQFKNTILVAIQVACLYIKGLISQKVNFCVNSASLFSVNNDFLPARCY